MALSFAARTAFRPFQMNFNRENTLPGLGQASADLQVRRSGPAELLGQRVIGQGREKP
jgi:hypothetical protein